MDLLKKLSIVIFYRKIKEKSIYLSERLDLFVIFAAAVLVLLFPALVINISVIPKNEEKPVNLYLSPLCGEFFGNKITEMLLREFEESEPGFSLRLLTDYEPPAAVKGRARPEEEPKEADIFIFDDSGFNALIAASSLMQLHSFADYEPAAPRFAIPLVSFMNMLFYNIELLSAAGFDRPPKTRDEFVAYTKRFTAEEFPGVAGAVFYLNKEDHQSLSRDIFSWIWAAGGNFRSEDGSLSLNTRAVSSDLIFLDNLYREGVIRLNAPDTAGNHAEEFAQGRAAMMIASTRDIQYLREKLGDAAFGITAIPSSETGGRYGMETHAIYAGINAGCAHPGEAWTFMEFLIEKIPLFCSEFKAVPGTVMQLIPGDYVKNDAFYSKAWDIYESSQTVQGFTGILKAAEYESAFIEELLIYFQTTRTAQPTVAAIQERWDALSGKSQVE